MTSVFGKGAISDRHPLALGDCWVRLTVYDELLAQADLALVVGSRIGIVSDVNLGARFPKRIVQVDIDPMVMGQRRPAEVGVVGDAAAVLSAGDANRRQGPDLLIRRTGLSSPQARTRAAEYG